MKPAIIQIQGPIKAYNIDAENECLRERWIESLEKHSVDTVVFWYITFGYEGSGHALFRRNGVWYHEDMGHNSGNSPFEDIAYKEYPFDDAYPQPVIMNTLANMSQELRDQLKPITDVMRELAL